MAAETNTHTLSLYILASQATHRSEYGNSRETIVLLVISYFKRWISRWKQIWRMILYYLDLLFLRDLAICSTTAKNSSIYFKNF
ncbi:hypothetical protein Lalb_Chr02g0151361 [Lupinus albus]|uniref:Uncharacterized protein n=1 Tax=Lupinus albus TaxID=3870 RepID=A0A6A4R0M8_LUPAL|nr:hypothetical protein Lalb_Chr02g0151361 [Lupinus albus]